NSRLKPRFVDQCVRDPAFGHLDTACGVRDVDCYGRAHFGCQVEVIVGAALVELRAHDGVDVLNVSVTSRKHATASRGAGAGAGVLSRGVVARLENGGGEYGRYHVRTAEHSASNGHVDRHDVDGDGGRVVARWIGSDHAVRVGQTIRRVRRRCGPML